MSIWAVIATGSLIFGIVGAALISCGVLLPGILSASYSAIFAWGAWAQYNIDCERC